MGCAIVLGNLLWALGVLMVPFASTSILLIGAAQVVERVGAAIWSVNQMSLRQSITPAGLFARATAARRFLMITLQITGAALGGLLGVAIGLRGTMVVGAAGLIAGFLLIWFSPVRDASAIAASA